MQILMALGANDLEAAKRLQKELVTRELRTASMALLVTVLCQKKFVCDPAFTPDRLTQKLTYWLSQLLNRGAGGTKTLNQFINLSGKYVNEFPGIDQLLLRE